jgi:poly(3-hydroxybutyrate) depolymerase
MKWFAGLLVIPALAAQQLRKGEVIDRVEVPGHPGQTYALYVPSGYTPDRVWPVLYCLDPGARGKAPVDRFAAAAEKAGVIVAGSNNSRNGPLAPSQEAINLMVGDTHARFAIDDSRIYVAGLSGGARLALGWAMGSHIAGVVASSAGFPTVGVPKQVAFRIYLTTGYDDFNHDELYHLSRDLARRNMAHRYVEFQGGHEWLPASLTGEALAYLAGTVTSRAAEASKEAEREAEEFQQRYREVETASDGSRPGIVRQLQKDTAREVDSPQRRVARRVMGSISSGSMEQMRAAMSEKRYSDAVHYAETAVLIRPENANAWYSLAVARAASGNAKRAIEALEQAVEHGFRGVDRVEGEALLEKVRRDKRYGELVEKMKAIR